MKAHLFYLHATSPLHAGIGQAIGVVDLPIARDRASNIPLIPGSGLKGSLREDLSTNPNHRLAVEQLFGPGKAPEEAWAGAVAFGDAHLLMLPVRSFNGVMTLITCPFVLHRYANDINRCQPNHALKPPSVASNHILTAPNSPNLITHNNTTKVILEDLDLEARTDHADWHHWCTHLGSTLFQGARQNDLQTRMALVDDDTFVFLCETATDIRARIAIDPDKGVVSTGALWYEENLPCDSILWGTLGIGLNRSKHGTPQDDMVAVWQQIMGKERLIKIGGKGTVGRGLVRWVEGKTQ